MFLRRCLKGCLSSDWDVQALVEKLVVCPIDHKKKIIQIWCTEDDTAAQKHMFSSNFISHHTPPMTFFFFGGVASIVLLYNATNCFWTFKVCDAHRAMEVREKTQDHSRNNSASRHPIKLRFGRLLDTLFIHLSSKFEVNPMSGCRVMADGAKWPHLIANKVATLDSPLKVATLRSGHFGFAIKCGHFASSAITRHPDIRSSSDLEGC